MRRLISDAVQVKPPLPQTILLTEGIDPDKELRLHLPTDPEVRDAMMKLAAQLHDTISARTAGQDGGVIGDMETTMLSLDMGEVVLRGSVIIERADA